MLRFSVDGGQGRSEQVALGQRPEGGEGRSRWTLEGAPGRGKAQGQALRRSRRWAPGPGRMEGWEQGVSEGDGPGATLRVDWALMRQEPWGVEQSRGSPSLSLTGSPDSCGDSDRSRDRAEARTRQEPTAPAQARW